METSSYLHKSGSVPELLRASLNQFGDFAAMAEAFGVKEATVSRWFRAGARAPGRDIREEMQNYLPGQERTVIVSGNMADSGRERRLEITLNREDNIEYSRMLAEGKEQAARVFLIAAEHGAWAGVPALAGAEWYPEDVDFYDQPDYEYDEEYSIE